VGATNYTRPYYLLGPLPEKEIEREHWRGRLRQVDGISIEESG